jgi:hypothetical protein
MQALHMYSLSESLDDASAAAELGRVLVLQATLERHAAGWSMYRRAYNVSDRTSEKGQQASISDMMCQVHLKLLRRQLTREPLAAARAACGSASRASSARMQINDPPAGVVLFD